ncbi:hypothetical protein [Microvirga roseola]|uniref:hypothetical protein n=1 Tax=Microvirga roseola TaxID=2883126 RepID=UPI001E32D404|nr:hypothetical protein [Microvirga roseola]
MALPVWPASLPVVPLRDGTGPASLYDPPIETEMEDGPRRMRRRSTTTWATVAVRFKLTNDQFATFQAFVRDTLDHGASRFTMPVWKPGATLPLPDKTVQLIGDPQMQTLGPFNFVALQLCVLDY